MTLPLFLDEIEVIIRADAAQCRGGRGSELRAVAGTDLRRQFNLHILEWAAKVSIFCAFHKAV